MTRLKVAFKDVAGNKWKEYVVVPTAREVKHV
jgi:hypothetical protein